jgi:carbamoyltransferase
MFTLGLSNMRDAAAALVHDGQIVAAAEEERFVRIKHVSALPVHAVRYCLKEAGLRLSDVDAVAVPWKYWEIGTRARLALGAMLRSPQLFREKGRRSIERLRQEWWELACLRRKLTEQIDGTPVHPSRSSITTCAMPPVRSWSLRLNERPSWSSTERPSRIRP